MKKVVLLIVALVVLGVGGFVVTRQDDKATSTTPAQSAAAAPNSTGAINNSISPGAYLDYTSDIIAQTTGTKILFFHAPWCPQCRELDADIKSKGVPSGVSIIKVDYDTHQSLRQKYGVTIQTTLVKIDDNGQLLEKYVAYDEPNLESVKRNLLD